MTKTFKIGEYAIGDIIVVSFNKFGTCIKALDWNTKKIVDIKTIGRSISERAQIEDYLHHLTSSYYADKILKYITQ